MVGRPAGEHGVRRPLCHGYAVRHRPILAVASDPLLKPIYALTAALVAWTLVDPSPMSTSCPRSWPVQTQPRGERMFFRALLLWAIAMIAGVPRAVCFLVANLVLLAHLGLSCPLTDRPCLLTARARRTSACARPGLPT